MSDFNRINDKLVVALNSLADAVKQREAANPPRRVRYSETWVQRLKDDVERLRTLYGKTVEKLTAAEAEIERLTNSIHRAKDDRDYAQYTCNVNRKAKDEAVGKRMEAEAKAAALEAEVARLKSENEKAEKAVFRWADAAERLKNAKQTALDQRDAAIARAERAEARVAELSGEAARSTAGDATDADELRRLRSYLTVLNEVGGRVTPGADYEADAKAYFACAQISQGLRFLSMAMQAFESIGAPKVPAEDQP